MENQKPNDEAKSEAALPAPTGSAYLVDCDQHGKEPLEYPTISEALADNRVVKITKLEDGRFEVREMCDEWAMANLTREQLLAWAEELKALAGMPNDGADLPRISGVSQPQALPIKRQRE